MKGVLVRIFTALLLLLDLVSPFSVLSSHSQQHQQQQLCPIRTSSRSRLFGSTTMLPLSSSSTVIHGVTKTTGPLNEAVALLANISLANANDLIAMGAVWAKVLTRLPRDDDETTRNDDWSNHHDDNNDVDDDDLDSYLEQMESTRYRRMLTPQRMEAGTDVRIYTKPRRFTEACSKMTRSSIVYEDTTFVVVDKPPMLPTQPDASNYVECCPGCVPGPFYDIQNEWVQRPYLCHRVDTSVGGLVVLSKDRHGQAVFAQYQRERKLRKLYLALTTQPVPLGQHVHWMWASQTRRHAVGKPVAQLVAHAPPSSRRKARQFWNRCVLHVVDCVPLSAGSPYYQSTIRLVTGRKHQVRAQLASLGCPIVRDTLYGPLSGLTLEGSDDAALDAALAQAHVPTEPIGLQAHAIMFGGIRVKAGAPWWWRNNTATAMDNNHRGTETTSRNSGSSVDGDV